MLDNRHFGSFGTGNWALITEACDPNTHPKAVPDCTPGRHRLVSGGAIAQQRRVQELREHLVGHHLLRRAREPRPLWLPLLLLLLLLLLPLPLLLLLRGPAATGANGMRRRALRRRRATAWSLAPCPCGPICVRHLPLRATLLLVVVPLDSLLISSGGACGCGIMVLLQVQFRRHAATSHSRRQQCSLVAALSQ